ncbi:MAG: PSD1 domain-containing protein [Planctomycetaceae bacterium]|nr:PSD1 domain-containing protein [Planctomycetaceae bacterium]
MTRAAYIVAGWFVCCVIAVSVRADESVDFFETNIRPVLVKHCYECHSSTSTEAKGGLLVDFREGLLKGGESGPSVVPHQPDESLLLAAMRHESFEMPPSGKLPEQVIADFEQWIKDGAVDPRDEPPSPTQAAEMLWKEQLAERRDWWSLQPPEFHSPPQVDDEQWSREPVDQFVWSAMDEAGLSPVESANATTLLRRLSFVLTGLPPTPEQVASFPAAYEAKAELALETLVDELLDSPQFGERFARHWMDVIRYTDTYGYEWDNPARGSWEYRDYLIRAFNEDVGFDQLIREQIAGDLLAVPRINSEAGLNESMIGPMFFHLGEHRHGSSLAFNGIHQDMVNNKIDAFSKAFLAMTVACARCHDHKLDAISQADYYALAGVFMSPRWTARVIDAPGKHDQQIEELKQLREEIHRELASLWQSNTTRLQAAELRSWAESQASSWTDAKLDEMYYPLAKLVGTTDDTIVETWSTLEAEWQTAREQRAESNAAGFTVLTDFSEPGLPDGWVAEGDGMVHGYVNDGMPLVSLADGKLVERMLPRGYHTHALSSKLAGAVRLPSQDAVPGQFVSLELQGGEWAGSLVVPQNAFQNEPLSFLGGNSDTSSWVTVTDETLKNGVCRVLTEIDTATLHPNFPPRTGLAKVGEVTLPDDDLGINKRSWFSLTKVVTHDAAGTPTPTLDEFAPLLTEDSPVDVDDAWQRVSAWLTEAVTRWSTNVPTTADVRLMNWLVSQELLPNRPDDSPVIASLVERYRDVENRIDYSRSVISMDERGVTPVDYRLNVRGDVDNEGPAIPRGFLEVFADTYGVGETTGSGRLELAEYLSSPDNPQTARVYVNRVWQWVFGTGIVATPSDFGKLGDRPSHLELLDWLALQFMSEGWSTKKLIRRLVLSQTFRQSGTVTDSARESDPDNRLLHHFPTRRLEAEALRDSLLFVSGELDAQLYGPPIHPPRLVEDGAKRLLSGALDSEGRRSIYMQMSIMDPPKFLVCFNLPDLKLPTGRRDVTNVPVQALALLNDPFVVQMSEKWGERLIADDSASAEQRVRAMFVRALGRSPGDRELRRWTDAVADFSQSDELMTDTNAWTELAHAMFNTKEFLYYQ